jgi:hypothetical protein
MRIYAEDNGCRRYNPQHSKGRASAAKCPTLHRHRTFRNSFIGDLAFEGEDYAFLG